MNHTLPIAVIVTDFMFNCTPFILRQYMLNSLIMVWYPIYSIIANYRNDTLYDNIYEWSETRVGLLYPLLLIPVGWIMHWIVTYIYIFKLKIMNKKEALKTRRDIYAELRELEFNKHRHQSEGSLFYKED